MTETTPRISRFGLLIAALGMLLAGVWFATLVALERWPNLFAGQNWLVGMTFVALAGIALIMFGIRFWLSFRAAEKIADASAKAERNGVHPLITLAVAGGFGSALIFPLVWRQIKPIWEQQNAQNSGAWILEGMVIGAPVILFVTSLLIMGKHRAKRPSSVQEHLLQKQAEQRHTVKLLIATPFVILVPYLIWVALQPLP